MAVLTLCFIFLLHIYISVSESFAYDPSTDKEPLLSCGSRLVRSMQTSRIVGGSQVRVGEIPWMVSIQKKKGKKRIYFCGGSVLTERWIVTAAHCLVDYNLKTLIVMAGEQNVNFNEGFEQLRNVRKVVKHPFYTVEGSLNDIALLELEHPLRMGYKYRVGSICLPDQGQSFTGSCTVAGWGQTAEEENQNHGDLNAVSVPIVKDPSCNDLLPQQSQQYFICAGYPQGGKDSCQGDSGGPLFCPDPMNNAIMTLAGVVSWGVGCARPNLPGIYTRVSKYSDWIKEVIPNYSPYYKNSAPRRTTYLTLMTISISFVLVLSRNMH